MRQAKIKIIAIEGMHNSGKSTQIERLYFNLKQIGVLGIVLRCHGFRPGLDLDADDPLSPWWQKNYASFMEAGKKGGEYFMKAEGKATNKLHHELFAVRKNLPKIMKNRGFDKGLIILNRSIISRLFVWQGHSRDLSYKGLLSFTYKDGANKRIKEVPLPDLIIVLRVSQKELLKRNKSRLEAKDKILLSKKIILDRYHDYDKLIKNLPEDIQKRIFIVDAGRSEIAVQREIIKLVQAQFG